MDLANALECTKSEDEKKQNDCKNKTYSQIASADDHNNAAFKSRMCQKEQRMINKVSCVLLTSGTGTNY